jgi:hypothetical protein
METTGDKRGKWFYRCNGTRQWLADRPGFIYLMDAGDGLFKIGRSADPETRLVGLRSEYRRTFTLLHKIPVDDMKAAERAGHRMFKARAARPYYICEWYRLTPADVAKFKTLSSSDLCPTEAAK